MKYPKSKKVVLKGDKYHTLQQQVFEASDWRCQICKKRKPLQMHHMMPRSLGRRDEFDNCISCCAPCHERITRKFIVVTWQDNKRRTLLIE